MIYWLLGIIVFFVLMSAVVKGVRESSARKKKKVIPSPRVGMLNLMGEDALNFMKVDGKFLESLFGEVTIDESKPPECDVLFIYCEVTEEGGIRNYDDGLREMIQDSRARIVVIAVDNPSENYTAAAVHKDYGQANLVMTINRKGEAFALFFERLFKKMQEGSTMPLAWDSLAPQRPGSRHKDCPGAIFVCEAGHLSFK